MKGRDKMGEAASRSGGGQFLKLEKGKPIGVEIIEYLGQFDSTYVDTGKSVKVHRWKVVVDGSEKLLEGNWRLLKAISDALEDHNSEEPDRVTITRTKIVAEIDKGNGVKQEMLVNNYEVVPF